VEGGVVRLDGSTTWKTGQAVLVIPIEELPVAGDLPPAELLAEDASEFAPRRDALRAANDPDLG
jgi:hypothetical protein